MKKDHLNILLVDDDEINNFLSEELINEYSTSVSKIISKTSSDQAVSYLEQLIKLNESLPDIILLDINMPKQDGWDFLKRLESFSVDNLLKVKIYIYTSSVYYADINKAKAHKLVSNIYTKPLTKKMMDEMEGKV